MRGYGGGYGYGGPQRREERPSAERISLSLQTIPEGIEGYVEPGGTFFFGAHYRSGLGVMVVFRPTQGEDGKPGAPAPVLVTCSPVTGQPLGDELEMRAGFPAMPGLPVAPVQVWTGGGWMLSLTGAGGELVRQVEQG